MLGVLASERRTMRPLPPQTAGLAGGLTLVFSLMAPTVASQSPAASSGCHITGRALERHPSLARRVDHGDGGRDGEGRDVFGPDGTFSFHVPPASTYVLKVELMGFVGVSRELVAGPPPCDQKIELELELEGRTGTAGDSTGTTGTAVHGYGRYDGYAGTTGTTGARGAGPRFETLAVETNANAAAAAVVAAPEREGAEAAARLLLPPGFSTEGPTEAVAINGGMASIDRGMMNDRMAAIGRGEVDPLTGEFRPPAGPGGEGGRRARRPRSWRSWRPGWRRWARRPARTVRARWSGGGPGGPGGPGRLGGRGVQQNPYSFTDQLRVRRLGARQRAVSVAARHPGVDAALFAAQFRRQRRPARSESRRSTTARVARISSSPTAAISRTTCSINTRRCRPTPIRVRRFLEHAALGCRSA